MDDNSLLMIVLAFVVGYMASGMMKQMCGGRLVEGKAKNLNSRIKSCELGVSKVFGDNGMDPTGEELIGQNTQNIDSIYSFLHCLRGDHMKI